MTNWRADWTATVASDVATRDGLGWEFTSADGQLVWEVSRDDAGPFPVFSAVRGECQLPTPEFLLAMTHEAVADLLAAARLADEVGWMTANLSAALLFASIDIARWEGEEWALESDPNDLPLTWTGPEDPRAPYAWLRACPGGQSAHGVGIYQDDALFGLDFTPSSARTLPTAPSGSLRPHADLPLVTGPVTRVDLAYDTLAEGGAAPGTLTEVLLTGASGSTLFIAAEAYSADEWHLYDGSVTVLRDLQAADSMTWIPKRTPWRPPA